MESAQAHDTCIGDFCIFKYQYFQIWQSLQSRQSTVGHTCTAKVETFESRELHKADKSGVSNPSAIKLKPFSVWLDPPISGALRRLPANP